MNPHGGQVWSEAGTRVLGLDFSANLWPERGVVFPKKLRALVEPYPDAACRALVAAASRHYRVDATRILAVNGATEGLYLTMRWLRARRVAVLAPSFSEYAAAARWGMDGVEIRHIATRPENDFAPDLQAMGSDVAVLGHPNNPTGTLLPRAELAAWLEARERAEAWTVVDEAFMDFVREPERASVLEESGRGPHLIVLRSLTKRFGIAGLRLGFAIAAPEVIAELRATQIPWSVNTLAQQVGTALLDREVNGNFGKRIAQERAFLTRGLRRLGFRVFPAAANFVLLQMPDGLPNSGLLAALRERGIGVRDGSNFEGLDDSYLRCAVRPRGEARQLLAVLKEISSGRW